MKILYVKRLSRKGVLGDGRESVYNKISDEEMGEEMERTSSQHKREVSMNESKACWGLGGTFLIKFLSACLSRHVFGGSDSIVCRIGGCT